MDSVNKVTFFPIIRNSEKNRHSSLINLPKKKFELEEVVKTLNNEFRKIDLLKSSLFGENYDNYGKMEYKNKIYNPYKFRIDYYSGIQIDDKFGLLNAMKGVEEHNYLKEKQKIRNIKPISTNYKNMFKKNEKFSTIDEKKKINLKKKSFSLLKKDKNRKSLGFRKSRNFKFEEKPLEIYNKIDKVLSMSNLCLKGMKETDIINETKIPQFKYRFNYLKFQFL